MKLKTKTKRTPDESYEEIRIGSVRDRTDEEYGYSSSSSRDAELNDVLIPSLHTNTNNSNTNNSNHGRIANKKADRKTGRQTNRDTKGARIKTNTKKPQWKSKVALGVVGVLLLLVGAALGRIFQYNYHTAVFVQHPTYTKSKDVFLWVAAKTASTTLCALGFTYPIGSSSEWQRLNGLGSANTTELSARTSNPALCGLPLFSAAIHSPFTGAFNYFIMRDPTERMLSDYQYRVAKNEPKSPETNLFNHLEFMCENRSPMCTHSSLFLEYCSVSKNYYARLLAVAFAPRPLVRRSKDELTPDQIKCLDGMGQEWISWKFNNYFIYWCEVDEKVVEKTVDALIESDFSFFDHLETFVGTNKSIDFFVACWPQYFELNPLSAYLNGHTESSDASALEKEQCATYNAQDYRLFSKLNLLVDKRNSNGQASKCPT